MAKANLSKSGMQKERENLKLYRKVLPSLDLKRRQLLGEQKRAEIEFAELKKQIDDLKSAVAKQVPMLGARSADITGIVAIKAVHDKIENVVGVKLPAFESIDFEIRDYSKLGKPHWVDLVIRRLQEYAELDTRYNIMAERVSLLAKAVRKVTQRINLFQKILIPKAEENIRRILIFLADRERAAVVQSKIAKAKGRQRREDSQIP
jgi:V/A-type H+-transporting ATPase subunit D